MPSPKMMPNYGILNKIERPFSAPRINTERFNSIETTKAMVRSYYTPDALSNTGPYKGIVLRVEDESKPEIGSWVERYFKDVGKPTPKLVRIKVRIPEIHSMLPIPKTLGKSSEEQAIIDMYPTFIAQNRGPELENPPEVGALVWVDFGNKTNFTDPIYIRPVDNTPGTGAVGKTSGADSFNSLCPGNLSSNPPKGDELPGKNKALSHAGLPLLPRKPASCMVGESVLLKTNRFNTFTVSTWEKELKSSGVPGKTWIGCLNSNGIDDKTHQLGKRETIIYSPNTTDFTFPIELIYYFHGFKEFNNGYDFQKRYPANIKKMVSDGRNFVLVIPELSWCKNTLPNKAQSNSATSNVWKGTDNFVNFDSEVRSVLKESFSSNLNVQYISIIAGNLGIKSIVSAYQNGLDTIKPNRLVLTEFDQNGYKNIVKGQEIDLVLKKGSEDEKRYNSLSDPIIKNSIIAKSFDVDEKSLLDMIIPYVADDEKKKTLPNQPESKLPASKNADVPPSMKPKVTIDEKDQTFDVIMKSAVPYSESRVSLKDYGQLQGSEDVLVPVTLSTTKPSQMLHVLVNKRLMALNDAWKNDNSGYPDIKISSGWRKRPWATEADYEADMRSRGYNNIEEARKMIAYNSPHEAGLAFDIATNGLTPNSKTISQQQKTKLFKWMVDNAHKFGITPYKNEPWHWECRLPRESWASGKEFTDNLSVRIENPGKGGNIPMANSIFNKNCVASIGDIPVATQGGDIPIGEIGKSLSEAKELKLLWSDFADGKAPSVSQLVSWGKIIDSKLRNIIQKYQGSVPYGLICIRMGHETRGHGEKIVTKCCGETSWMQVWHGKKFAETKNVNDAVGLGAKCAKKIPNYDPFNPEHNILCGLADWNDRGHIMSVRLQKYFPEPDAQFWAMVNVGMSIGDGATSKLLKLANPTPGNALNELCQWIVDQGSNLEKYKGFFGSQSAAKVARRVLVTSYWIEAARQLTGKDLYSSNFGLEFNKMVG